MFDQLAEWELCPLLFRQYQNQMLIIWYFRGGICVYFVLCDSGIHRKLCRCRRKWQNTSNDVEVTSLCVSQIPDEINNRWQIWDIDEEATCVCVCERERESSLFKVTPLPEKIYFGPWFVFFLNKLCVQTFRASALMIDEVSQWIFVFPVGLRGGDAEVTVASSDWSTFADEPMKSAWVNVLQRLQCVSQHCFDVVD